MFLISKSTEYNFLKQLVESILFFSDLFSSSGELS